MTYSLLFGKSTASFKNLQMLESQKVQVNPLCLGAGFRSASRRPKPTVNMTASECIGALRHALWHITSLRGLGWLDRLAVGALKIVAIAGYHYGKWQTLGVAPPRRPDGEVSRRGLDPLIQRALKGCRPNSRISSGELFRNGWLERRMPATIMG